MRAIRCSDLPRISTCPLSADAPPQVSVEHEGDDSGRLGKAFHAAMADWAAGRRDVDVPDYCRQFSVDASDLWPLVGIGRRIWDEYLGQYFPNPIIESEMRFEDAQNGITLTGHPDLMACVDDELRIPDYFSGWRQKDKSAQLRGYALLGMIRFPQATRARMATIRVRSQRADWEYVWTREDLFDWWGRLVSSIKLATRYVTSEECGFCPMALECPAHAKEMSFALLAGADEVSTRMSPEQLASTVTRLRTAENVIKRLLTAAKAHVQAEGGKFGPLELVQQERRAINPEAGWELLVEGIGLDRLKKLVKVGVGDVGDAIKETAPARGKGKAVEAFMTKLEEAGAINVGVIERLEVRKKPEAIKVGTAPVRPE